MPSRTVAAMTESSRNLRSWLVASVRPGLSCTPAARESMAYLLDPPGLDEEIAGFWQDVRDAAIAVLPEWARQMYG
jgi:hypothetical protein